MEPGISVVIPVYNAASYLDECISSVLSQSFTSFELLCVDDGSGDDSYHILEHYADIDSRVKIFRQKNKGAGTARNLGLQNAVGKYVLFLDADDFFEREMLYKLFSLAEDKAADIVVCSADAYDTLKSSYFKLNVVSHYPGVRDFFSASEVVDYIFNFTAPAPWNKLFRRDFIVKQAILFQTIKSTNDLCFVYSALACCSRIAILDEILVHYRINNAYSLQGSCNKDTLDAFRALAGLKKYLVSRKMFLKYAYSFYKLVGNIGVYTLANVPVSRFKHDVMSDQLYNYLLFLVDDYAGTEIDLSKKNVVIYGAGQIAVVLVRCLVELVGLEKKNIIVVVSSLKGNHSNICDIPVIEICKSKAKKNTKMLICSSVASSRQNMTNTALEMGYTDIISIDEIDILQFCKVHNSKHQL